MSIDTRSYTPAQIGSWWEYVVDSVIYDLSASTQRRIDSSRSYMRWEIMEESSDDSYRLLVSRRSSLEEDWSAVSNWRITRDQGRYTRQEGNIALLLWPEPLQATSTWSATDLLDPSLELIIAGEPIQPYDRWDSRVGESPASISSPAGSFTDLLSIELVEQDFLIEYRDVTEIYARDVGLVWQQQSILDTQCRAVGDGDITLCNDVTWTDKAERGWTLTTTLIDFSL